MSMHSSVFTEATIEWLRQISFYDKATTSHGIFQSTEATTGVEASKLVEVARLSWYVAATGCISMYHLHTIHRP
jgi:hypothetical protein